MTIIFTIIFLISIIILFMMNFYIIRWQETIVPNFSKTDNLVFGKWSFFVLQKSKFVVVCKLRIPNADWCLNISDKNRS